MPIPDIRALKSDARALIRTGSVSPIRMTALLLVISFALDLLDSSVSYMIGSSGGFTVLSFSFISILIELVTLVLNAGYTCYSLGILRGERRLLVREIHFGTGRHGLLAGFGLHRLGNGLDTGTLRTRRGLGFRHGLLRRRRFSHGHLCRGRSRNGFFRLGFFCRGCFHDGFRLRCCGGLGFRDFGSHFGSYGLHIFSSIADSLLGSRKIRIFSSHLSTRF